MTLEYNVSYKREICHTTQGSYFRGSFNLGVIPMRLRIPKGKMLKNCVITGIHCHIQLPFVWAMYTAHKKLEVFSI
jgi:hypothetical protein